MILAVASLFLTSAQLKLFEELGIEEYRIKSAHDERTCGECREMDGKQSRVKTAKITETAPPFHPNCRCRIEPVLNKTIPGAGRITKLYRAMSKTEYDSIVINGGKFSNYDYAMQEKWFAVSPEGAARWGKAFYPDGNYMLIEIDVPFGALTGLYYVENLDSYGPAYCIGIDVLNSILEGLRLL